MGKELDPITYEVISHRLWQINEEAISIVRATTPSHIINEARDFNVGIMNSEGDILIFGMFINFHGSTLSTMVKYLLKEYKENPGINEGDMFLTNDTFLGSTHLNDTMMVAPIFWEGEIVSWTGCTIHEEDVGGATPGSFCIYARNMFEDPPAFSPFKIVERDVLRKDLLSLWKRNVRMPHMLDGNVRARIAALNVGKTRLLEIIRRYGVDTIKQVFAKMTDNTEKLLRERLLEIPDGTWRNLTFMDHQNQIFPMKVSLTKKSDRLIFDFRGSAMGLDGSAGSINITLNGTRAGVEAAVLPMLCWDMPWTLGGLWRCMEIITEPGSIVHAIHPMATSLGINTVWGLCNLIAGVIGQMLSCSEKYKERAGASWSAAGHAAVWEGKNQFGEQSTNLHAFHCEAGGTGAWGSRDGEGCSGYIIASETVIPNLETFEAYSPVLYLFWKETPDSGGPGKFRGGPGPESAYIVHDTDNVRNAGLFHGAEIPMGTGIMGGQPGGTQRQIIIRGMKPKELLEKGKTFRSLNELLEEADRLGLSLEICPTGYETTLTPGDIQIGIGSGGGGYGDPIDRDPEAVLKDVLDGLVSLECARDIYGVEINPELLEIDMERTEYRRHEIKDTRLK